MVGVRSESTYVSALLRQRGPVYERLKKRYPNLVRYFEEKLKQYECPLCKKKFKTKYALYKHLLHSSPCSKLLLVLVEKLMENAEEREVLKVVE